MSKKQSAKERDLLKVIKDNYKESVDGWREIYDEASADMEFVYDVGDGQWPANTRKAREADGRPVITSNKLQKVLRRIRGDGMMNAPRLEVIPVDSLSDPKTAELYGGLIREIEYLSDAGVVYDTAYNYAISSSVGFLRLITQYSDENSFEQDIRIKRVLNPLSVHFDPYAQEFNLEDARYCFIEDLVDTEHYKKLYPGSDPSDFESITTSTLFGDWMKHDMVRVAEYFYKDPVQKKIVLLDNGTVVPVDDEITIRALGEMGIKVQRERTVETHVVRWLKTNGFEILEENIWPGKDIPIIPMLGDEIVVKGKRYYLSLARGGKGPQQMYNYWGTAATETVALTPKMPFILDHRQVKGFENEWDEANRTNRMYIRYNAVKGLQKPARENQAQVPTAIMNMMQVTAYDIEDHLGQYESSKGEASNERSRVAIVERVKQSDKGTYLFSNNRTRSIIALGRQVIDLIPKIYDTERAIQIMGETGEHTLADINTPVPDGAGGVTIKNDLSVGKYDLIASVGASFSSQRQEMVQTMIESMQYVPDFAPVIAPFIFKYSDAPGSDEIYAELTKAVQQMQQQPKE